MLMHSELYPVLVERLVNTYQKSLRRIILYGSMARGTATQESDIDIAVLLNELESLELKEKISDLVVDLQLEYDCVISLLPIEQEKFSEWEDTLPFYRNIKEEGIVLWTAV